MKRIALIIAILGLAATPLCMANESAVFSADNQSKSVQQKKKDKDNTKTVTFKTTIHCKSCVKKMNDTIAFQKGVKDLEVTLADKTVKITYDPAKTDEKTLAAAINKLGYEAEVVKEEK